MNLFRKQTQETSLVCRICKMEFTDSERTLRHMIKAHSKPQRVKKIENNPFIFDNYCRFILNQNVSFVLVLLRSHRGHLNSNCIIIKI